MTPANIQSVFRVTGILPFNECVFTDDEQHGTSCVPLSISGVPIITPEHIQQFKKA